MLFKKLKFFSFLIIGLVFNIESHAIAVVYSAKEKSNISTKQVNENKAPPTFPVEADFDRKVKQTILNLHDVFNQFADIKADETSVVYFDGYIQRNRQQLSKDTRHKVVVAISVLLGQAMIEKYGGEWVYVGAEKNDLAVKLGTGENHFIAFPFNEVLKQFENGDEDSILSFYQMTGNLLQLSKEGKL